MQEHILKNRSENVKKSCRTFYTYNIPNYEHLQYYMYHLCISEANFAFKIDLIYAMSKKSKFIDIVKQYIILFEKLSPDPGHFKIKFYTIYIVFCQQKFRCFTQIKYIPKCLIYYSVVCT